MSQNISEKFELKDFSTVGLSDSGAFQSKQKGLRTWGIRIFFPRDNLKGVISVVEEKARINSAPRQNYSCGQNEGFFSNGCNEVANRMLRAPATQIKCVGSWFCRG